MKSSVHHKSKMSPLFTVLTPANFQTWSPYNILTQKQSILFIPKNMEY